jgi:hypothetical protein
MVQESRKTGMRTFIIDPLSYNFCDVWVEYAPVIFIV